MTERAVTQSIQVEVTARFVPEQSAPRDGRFLFTYQIKISNFGTFPVQLVSRHWIITDGNGRTEEVKGPGVIGEQPWIQPAQSFQYESFCPLPTPTGSMQGLYEMTSEAGGHFSVEIPQFFLVEPSSFH
jgi:ApaG protein